MVVLGHMRVLVGKPLIYMFHMAFFFILSGYLYKCNSLGKEIGKSSRSLLLPYLCFNVILLGVSLAVGDFESGMIRNILLCNYELFPVRYFSPLWFLVSLFWIRLICSVVDDKFYPYLAVVVIAISAVLFYGHKLPLDKEPDYFQWATTCICFPSFVFGYFLHRKNWLSLPDKIQSGVLRHGILLVAILIMVLTGKFNGRVNVFTCAVGKDILLYYLVSTIISYVAIYYISKCLRKPNTIVEYISMGTILILALHISMIDGMSFGIHMNSLLSIVLAVIILSLSTGMIVLSLKYFPFLLGKTTKTTI